MKLEQLKQLVKIAEAGSMNKAAQEMFTARSSLSSSMKSLENELGDVLFTRSSGGIALTRYGAEVYYQAKEIIEKVDFLQEAAKINKRPKLSIASMYSSSGLLAVNELFRRCEDPRPLIDLDENTLMKVIEKVDMGLADIGIITIFDDSKEITQKKLEGTNLDFHPLMNRQMYAIVGPKNPLYASSRKSVKLSELTDYPYIVNYSAHTENAMSGFLEGRDMQRADVQVSDLSCALKIVEETDGYMIETNDKEIYEKLYAPTNYRFIRLSGHGMIGKLGWIKRKDRNLTMLEKEYINLISKYAKE